MAKILVVDDSLVDQKMVGKILEQGPGPYALDQEMQMTVLYASNGKAALEKMALEKPDLVLTDLQMPEMNGLELVDEIKATHPGVPVILMTAHGSEDIAIEALRKGAASYVPKRRLTRDLMQTVEDVLAVVSSRREQQRLLDECWMQSETHFWLPNDLSYIAPLVRHLQDNLTRLKVCEENDLIRVAVALREALSNAILHGNLELQSDLRETDEKQYWDLLRQRRGQEPYKKRGVCVSAQESRVEAVYTIRDEGPGFDVANLPDPMAEENLEKVSGRGLLLIRTFMDYTEFNKKGNEIKMIKRRK